MGRFFEELLDQKYLFAEFLLVVKRIKAVFHSARARGQESPDLLAVAAANAFS